MFSKSKTTPSPIRDTHYVPTPYQTPDTSLMSYKKTNKLVTAVYMVTDIIYVQEPMRCKLRNLGVDILSDTISGNMTNINQKVNQMLSFLEISRAVNIISEMNCNILIKEFIALRESIQEKEAKNQGFNLNSSFDLSDFFREEIEQPLEDNFLKDTNQRRYKSSTANKKISIGHRISNSVGVQKGSTLLKALSDKVSPISNTHLFSKNQYNKRLLFQNTKKERRDKILSFIKEHGKPGIKDMKNKLAVTQGSPGELNAHKSVSFSEKILQRELLEMVKEHILNKTGEKRWSRYSMAQPSDRNG